MFQLAATSILFAIAAAATFFSLPNVYAGNTTCASNQLDWYTSVVGETPCDTYQRLRGMCNPDYEVPNFRPDTPGDQCDDEVSVCCCNTVAFQLSMLCMNCQYDTVNGGNISGIDAGVGAYTLYRGTCGTGFNHSLPSDVQQGACNENIRLDDFLYGGWDDGAWFYVYTKEHAYQTHVATNNKTFTHCPDPNTTSSSSITTLIGSTETVSVTASDTSTTTVTLGNSGRSANDTRHSNTAAIVGGVLGTIAGLALLAGLFMLRRTRRIRRSQEQFLQSRPMSYSGPMKESVLPLSSAGAFRSGPLRSGIPSDVLEGSYLDLGHQTDTWERRMSSHNTNIGTMASLESLRSKDAGLVELFRSASGRLPPAYRSWGDQEYPFGPGMETQDSEFLPYQATDIPERRSARNVPLLPTPDDYNRGMLLAPLRRAPTRAY